jgi:hypothetical protein
MRFLRGVTVPRAVNASVDPPMRNAVKAIWAYETLRLKTIDPNKRGGTVNVSRITQHVVIDAGLVAKGK